MDYVCVCVCSDGFPLFSLCESLEDAENFADEHLMVKVSGHGVIESVGVYSLVQTLLSEEGSEGNGN